MKLNCRKIQIVKDILLNADINTTKPGTKENIRQNICKIVEQLSLSGFFNYYIECFEYTVKCFDKGNEIFESEKLGDK